ncbi:MAG: SDR family oxidoreductase [Pseudomonadota bacterium]
MNQKRVLVTGGGTGIGLAIAQQLASDNHQVTISGRSAETLTEAGLPYIVMDVTSEASVDRAFSELGTVDILISNAGAAKTAPLLKTPLATWQAMLDVNLTGAFLCARTALPPMIDSGWGRMVVIASTSSLKAYPYTGAYTASKHGVMGLVKTLAIELARTGVTVNAVCPGFSDTPLLTRSVENIVNTTGMNEEQALAALLKDNPMKRAVDPAEVAAAVKYLVSDDAAATNGQAVVIDGGELAG